MGCCTMWALLRGQDCDRGTGGGTPMLPPFAWVWWKGVVVVVLLEETRWWSRAVRDMVIVV